MRILQINTTINSGSTGRIAEETAQLIRQSGGDSCIAYGRGNQNSSSATLKVGNTLNILLHGLQSRLLDRHGFASGTATKAFVDEIKNLDPEIIHLHNVHGYYLNIEILFRYLRAARKPVVWTLHDCWPFTGHCAYFDRYSCEKWKTGCYDCAGIRSYPKSWFIDRSKHHYQIKKQLFTSLPQLVLVTPSSWLENHVKNSFLQEKSVRCIHNGVNLNIFKPADSSVLFEKYSIPEKNIILGVASTWEKRKGLYDFLALSENLTSSEHIVLIGLADKQIAKLPHRITGIQRTENMEELASFYAVASVFVNPTYVDNFPTTNIEALACGTPVVTYDTGGSPEAVDNATGLVIPKGDITGLYQAIQTVLKNGKHHYSYACRARAEQHFDKDKQYGKYLELYRDLLLKQAESAFVSCLPT